MIRYIVEEEVRGDTISEQGYRRTIKHLAAPWTLGTSNLWLGTDEIQPHNTSNPHAHANQEEIFFFLSGKGRVRVDDDEIEVGPGYCVFCPAGSVHQVLNDGDTILRFVAAVAPPFVPEKFKTDHQIK